MVDVGRVGIWSGYSLWPDNLEFAAELEEARARTLLLLAPLTDEELHTQHDPLMSPILWDLGHIAHFEELWLTRNLDGPIEFVEMPGMYNPFEHPRSTRGATGRRFDVLHHAMDARTSRRRGSAFRSGRSIVAAGVANCLSF